jgi:hypothetical protein
MHCIDAAEGKPSAAAKRGQAEAPAPPTKRGKKK